MNSLLVDSVFAKLYAHIFVPPITVRLSHAWGILPAEVHTQLLSWSLFACFCLVIVVVWQAILLRRRHKCG